MQNNIAKLQEKRRKKKTEENILDAESDFLAGCLAVYTATQKYSVLFTQMFFFRYPVF